MQKEIIEKNMCVGLFSNTRGYQRGVVKSCIANGPRWNLTIEVDADGATETVTVFEDTVTTPNDRPVKLVQID